MGFRETIALSTRALTFVNSTHRTHSLIWSSRSGTTSKCSRSPLRLKTDTIAIWYPRAPPFQPLQAQTIDRFSCHWIHKRYIECFLFVIFVNCLLCLFFSTDTLAVGCFCTLLFLRSSLLFFCHTAIKLFVVCIVLFKKQIEWIEWRTCWRLEWWRDSSGRPYCNNTDPYIQENNNNRKGYFQLSVWLFGCTASIVNTAVRYWPANGNDNDDYDGFYCWTPAAHICLI